MGACYSWEVTDVVELTRAVFQSVRHAALLHAHAKQRLVAGRGLCAVRGCPSLGGGWLGGCACATD